jgi:HEPN domain-containing protein
MPLPKNTLVEEWLKKALDDEQAARLLLKHQDAPLNAVSFHCQQMAEKHLKAYLVAREMAFPKIHFLDRLLKLCSEADEDFETLMKDAVLLNDYYTDTRYPEDYPELTPEECDEALKAALRIKKFVSSKI